MDGRGKKKKLTRIEVRGSQFETEAGDLLATTPGPGGSVFSRESAYKESKEVNSHLLGDFEAPISFLIKCFACSCRPLRDLIVKKNLVKKMADICLLVGKGRNMNWKMNHC